MAIDDLVSVIPPPANPPRPISTARWKEVEKLVGSALPADYRAFAERYGSGRFCHQFIRVFSPLDLVYTDWLQMCLDSLHVASEMGIKYEIHPARPGLLPWGDDENGGVLCWLTKGVPDEWPVVACGDVSFEEWKLPFTTFLARAFRNKIKVKLWHERFRPAERNFSRSDAST
jgi:hypothetical protein